MTQPSSAIEPHPPGSGTPPGRPFPWAGLSIAFFAGLALLMLSLLCPGVAAAQAGTPPQTQSELQGDSLAVVRTEPDPARLTGARMQEDRLYDFSAS